MRNPPGEFHPFVRQWETASTRWPWLQNLRKIPPSDWLSTFMNIKNLKEEQWPCYHSKCLKRCAVFGCFLYPIRPFGLQWLVGVHVHQAWDFLRILTNSLVAATGQNGTPRARPGCDLEIIDARNTKPQSGQPKSIWISGCWCSPHFTAKRKSPGRFAAGSRQRQRMCKKPNTKWLFQKPLSRQLVLLMRSTSNSQPLPDALQILQPEDFRWLMVVGSLQNHDRNWKPLDFCIFWMACSPPALSARCLPSPYPNLGSAHQLYPNLVVS